MGRSYKRPLDDQHPAHAAALKTQTQDANPRRKPKTHIQDANPRNRVRYRATPQGDVNKRDSVSVNNPDYG